MGGSNEKEKVRIFFNIIIKIVAKKIKRKSFKIILFN